jgi:CubicO group peptidase (beta-lactamase class C family)
MHRRLLTLLALAVLAVPAWAAPPRNLDRRVEELRREYGVPGIAIAIVENGRTTLARGWGVRRLGDDAKVDADTIFMTGSTGKAFTTAALARLVDAGRIGWDDRVIDHLPWFRMYDPYVTREITIRDLLVHRAGLPLGAGDLLFVPRSDRSRRDVVQRIAHLRPESSFRSKYAYDNVLYAVAGQLIEEVTGKTWEDFVADELLRPAGMNDTTTHGPARFANPNRAWPHARTSGPVRGLGEIGVLDERDELGRAAAPAGGMASSANDLAKWIRIQLARGEMPDGNRLYSAEAAEEMWAPVTPMPITHQPELIQSSQPRFQAYALGWIVRDYAGAKVIWHTGGVLGSIAAVVLLPEKNVGFAVLVNSEDVQVRTGLVFELLDHYLGVPFQDWPAKFAAVMDERLKSAAEALASAEAQPAAVGPSLPLEQYAGDYEDTWYGRISIRMKGGSLHIDFTETPRMEGPLEHWQYDTFVTRFTDTTIEPAYVTFSLDPHGKVERVTMKAVSPVADFSFDYHHLLFEPARNER